MNKILFFIFGLCYGSLWSQEVTIPIEAGTGIGFVNAQKLFFGSCRLLDLQRMTMDSVCMLPSGIRWSAMSEDGSLLIAVVAPDTQKNAYAWIGWNVFTKRYLWKEKGVWYAPPFAVHPQGLYYAIVNERVSGENTVEIYNTRQRTMLNSVANTHGRIHYLAFNSRGDSLEFDDGRVSLLDWGVTDLLGVLDSVVLCSSRGSYCLVQNAEGLTIEKRHPFKRMHTLSKTLQVDLDLHDFAFSPDERFFVYKGWNQQNQQQLLKIVPLSP